MINKTFIRWFLTILLILLFYLGLAVFDFGFSSSMTYNHTVMGANEPLSVWRAFVGDLYISHQNTMDYVYLGTPILLVLLFIIHKKIR